MALIQKIRLQGFKSFSKLTELIFPEGYSCILGPNGAGKSNITDSICFVLGKSSSRELRAEKASNLIYNGGKLGKPLKEAVVDVFFDNNNRIFPINKEKVKISRIVRQNGVSIYKIDDKTVTRQQVLELLGHAKIDPDGHNIILQGDIAHFIEMKTEDRRKLIEEVAGISVYEDKKAKALNELEKVEQKLNEAEIILTEREVYLRELKKDRDQALKYKELGKNILNSKATLIHLQIEEKEIKKDSVEKKLNEQREKLNKINNNIKNFRDEIVKFRNEIKEINIELEEKGEKEQLELRKKIENLKTDIAKFEERVNTCKNEINKIENRKKQLRSEISDTTEKIKLLRERRNNMENEIKAISNDKSKIITEIKNLKEINEELTQQRFKNLSLREITGDAAVQKILGLKEKGIYGTINQLIEVDPKYALAIEVSAGSRIKSIVVEDDIIAERGIKILKENKAGTAIFLPLNKIRQKEISDDIKTIASKTEGLAIDLIKFNKKFTNAMSAVFGTTIIVKGIEEARKIGIGRIRMVSLEGDLIEQSGAMIGGYRKRVAAFKDKDITNINKDIKDASLNLAKLENERYLNEKKLIEFKSEIKNIDIQIDSMLIPESDKTKKIQLQHEKELESFKNEFNELTEKIKIAKKELEGNENLEKKFYSRFKDLANKRNKLNEQIQIKEELIFKEEDRIKLVEEHINEISISRAKIVAEIEALDKEFEQFKEGAIIKNISIDKLKNEIQEFEKELKHIGTVNLKALEIYENIEKEHQELVGKASKLRLEKDDVLKMINEIEEKKKELFMQTFNIANENFRKIFSSLTTKGEAYLVLENQENPFNGGVDIVVKIAGNKFLDIKSLSGGEKTQTALSFIFAIQEFEPAPFYLLDEVDAALDKKNSEMLSILIKKYSGNVQYIVISHNDAIITEADQVYGVSMQDGISKIVSLKI